MAALSIDLASGEAPDEIDATVHRYSRTVVCVEATAERWAVADTDDFRQFSLDGTASALWRSFDGHRADAEIIADVLRAYPVHPESAAADCRSLIDELVRLRLLEPVGTEPGVGQAYTSRRELWDDLAD